MSASEETTDGMPSKVPAGTTNWSFALLVELISESAALFAWLHPVQVLSRVVAELMTTAVHRMADCEYADEEFTCIENALAVLTHFDNMWEAVQVKLCNCYFFKSSSTHACLDYIDLRLHAFSSLAHRVLGPGRQSKRLRGCSRCGLLSWRAKRPLRWRTMHSCSPSSLPAPTSTRTLQESATRNSSKLWSSPLL